MSLIIDKDGKIAEKHLTADLESIRRVISKKTDSYKQVLIKASKVKIERRIVS